MSCIKSCTFPENPWVNRRPLTKSRHLTCVAGNYLSPGPSGRRRGNYSSELSGRSELPFGRRQTVQRAGGLPQRSSPGPTGPLTCRCRKIGAHDALPSRRRFCVFWESAALVFPQSISSPKRGKVSPLNCDFVAHNDNRSVADCNLDLAYLTRRPRSRTWTVAQVIRSDLAAPETWRKPVLLDRCGTRRPISH